VKETTPAILREAMRNPSEEERESGRPGIPVHLKDIHLERGMHCVDCHFSTDVHGNGKLYGETRNAIEIDCVDCHGTTAAPATLRTSGPSAPVNGGNDLRSGATPFGLPRFSRGGGRVLQRSMVDEDIVWEVPQVNRYHHTGQPPLQRARTTRRRFNAAVMPGASSHPSKGWPTPMSA
jgi:hypothetical protein